MSGLALNCLLFGLQFATQDGDGGVAVVLLLAGAAAAAAYVRYALRHPHPILDMLRLLELRQFRLTLAGGSSHAHHARGAALLWR